MAPEISVKNGKLSRRVGISDTNLLLTITIVVFFDTRNYFAGTESRI